MGTALPAWQIFSRLVELAKIRRAKLSAASVMLDIIKNVPVFEGMRYKELSKVVRQFPDVGGDDLYYGGTAYQNKSGIGVQIATTADDGGTVKVGKVKLPEIPKAGSGEYVIIPTTRLYNRHPLFEPSALVHPRVMVPYTQMNTEDADALGVKNGDVVEISVNGSSVKVRASVSDDIQKGSLVLPRYLTQEATPMYLTVGTIQKVADTTLVGEAEKAEV